MTKSFRHVMFWVASHVLYGAIRLLNATYRFTICGEEHRLAAERHHPAAAFVLAVWHENLFATILSQIGSRYSPLASSSRDGDYASFVLKKLGFDPVRGSSTRGGPDARLQILAKLALGTNSAITVDGPRGPRREVKPGIIDIARKSVAAILPVAVVAEHFWTLGSWDRFRIPKPFSRITVRYGQPLFLDAHLEGAAFEACRVDLGHTLDELDDLALGDFPHTAMTVARAAS